MLGLASFRPSRIHLPARLPSTRFCCPRFPELFAPAVLCGLCLLAVSRKSVRSLRLSCLAFRSSRPQPRHAPERRFVSHLSAFGRPLRCQTSPSTSRLVATPRRIGFVILRADLSLPAAPHPASRRRSCLQLHAM